MELDKSWVGLRLYIKQDDGLWLFYDGVRSHPPFMTFKLDASQIRLAEATGLIRVAHQAGRDLKRFQLEKLPYNMVEVLADMLEQAFGTSVRVMNQESRNFDPAYRAVILFVEVKANTSQQYAFGKGQLKWFSLSDVLAADEQDGVIIGIDNFHLR